MTNRIVLIALCEETGQPITEDGCPTHGKGDEDFERRGFAAIPKCAAHYEHVGESRVRRRD